MTKEEADIIVRAEKLRRSRPDVFGDHVFGNQDETCVRCGRTKTDLFARDIIPACVKIPRYVK